MDSVSHNHLSHNPPIWWTHGTMDSCSGAMRALSLQGTTVALTVYDLAPRPLQTIVVGSRGHKVVTLPIAASPNGFKSCCAVPPPSFCLKFCSRLPCLHLAVAARLLPQSTWPDPIPNPRGRSKLRRHRDLSACSRQVSPQVLRYLLVVHRRHLELNQLARIDASPAQSTLLPAVRIGDQPDQNGRPSQGVKM